MVPPFPPRGSAPRPAQFRVRVLAEDATHCRLALAGQLDRANAELLCAILATRLDAGCRILRIDVSQLSFCDRAAADALLEIHEQTLARRGTLVFAGAGDPFLTALAAAGLDDVLFTVTVADLGADGPGAGSPPQPTS